MYSIRREWGKVNLLQLNSYKISEKNNSLPSCLCLFEIWFWVGGGNSCLIRGKLNISRTFLVVARI